MTWCTAGTVERLNDEININGEAFIVMWFLRKENAVTLRRNSPPSVIIGPSAKTRMNDFRLCRLAFPPRTTRLSAVPVLRAIRFIIRPMTISLLCG